MECKACGVWFVSGDKSGVCHTCKRTLKNMGLDLPYDRLRELVEADRDGRCVVLPVAKRKDRESLFDALSEAVSSWGDMSNGEKNLAEAILNGLKGECDAAEV